MAILSGAIACLVRSTCSSPSSRSTCSAARRARSGTWRRLRVSARSWARDSPARSWAASVATIYVGAGALFAGSVALIGLDPGSVVVLACVVGAGMGWAFVYVEALTLAQRLAGDDVMSRVFGVMESTMMASQAAGALSSLCSSRPSGRLRRSRLRAGVWTRGRGRGTSAHPRRPSRSQSRPPIAGTPARADVRSPVGAGSRTARNQFDDDVGRDRGDDRGGR